MRAFQNLSTGLASGAPSGATTSADLNRSSLSWQACPPLKRLHERLGGGDVLRASALNVGGCAGITCPPQHNAHAIAWPGVGRINGLLIPSLQRFTIIVPARLDPQSSGEVFEVGLTQHHLYLIGGTSRVFSAPAPTAPGAH
jgi:hypothetical protein